MMCLKIRYLCVKQNIIIDRNELLDLLFCRVTTVNFPSEQTQINYDIDDDNHPCKFKQKVLMMPLKAFNS
jgi:hypothetical protein